MSADAVLLMLLGGEAAGSALVAAMGLVAVLGLVTVYVAFALPHLNDTPALLGSLLLGLALAVVSGVMVGLSGVALPVLPAWGALLVGHVGLRAGRRQGPSTRPAVAPVAARTANRGAGVPAASSPSPAPERAPAAAAAAAPTATPTAATAAASRLPAPAPVDPPPDRSTLGRYRIDRQLGRGAMGAVYLGHDPKIGRQVAIKTMALAQEFDGAELADARERFFREAETAGRLRHPDIVTIFDAGEDQDLAFIAMEFVAGHDLQRHTRVDTLLPVPLALRVVERVAEALAHAHSQGVVHRDIKPANVMVDLPSAGDLSGLGVKVTDFGIARVGDASRTRTGMVLGTPAFMSPEQMAGQRVDGRSDLYSLGVMLFQLLTGRLPHHAESMARLMSAIAHERAPDVRSIRAELPEALADIVGLALEKRPEVRYADGRQLAEDLRAVQAMYGVAPLPDAAAALASAPPASGASDAFAATVKFVRDDPGHNSGG